MIGFIMGFLSGIVFSIMIAPFAVRWLVKKKLNDLTGGLLQ